MVNILSLSALDTMRVSSFDYTSLDPDLAQQARKAAVAINRIVTRDLRIVGRHLLAAKEALPHGRFSEWAQIELGMTARAVQYYMTGARFLEGKNEAISLLPAKVIYALAAPSTPARIVEAVVAEAEAGVLPAAEVVAHRIDVALAEAREVKRLTEKKPGRTEEDARKVLAKSRQAAAQRREEDRRQQEQERFARVATQQHQRETLSALAVTHRDVLLQIHALASTDLYGFKQALSAVVNEESGR